MDGFWNDFLPCLIQKLVEMHGVLSSLLLPALKMDVMLELQQP